MRGVKCLIVLVLVLFQCQTVQAGWFGNSDPDRRPNIFSRMGKGLVDSVTGLFKKKEPVARYPYNEETYDTGYLDETILEEPSSSFQSTLEEVAAIETSPSEEFVPQDLTNPYFRRLQRIILSYAHVPIEVQGSGLTESVKVFFVVYPDGEIGKVFIPERFRSAYGFINEAAIDTVQRASTEFPPFPSNFEPTEKVFNIEILYEDN